MGERNTLSVLAEELGNLVAPLEDALSSPEYFTAFMRELGWNLQLIPSPFQALATLVGEIGQQTEGVASDPSKLSDFMGLLKSFFTSLEGIKDHASGQFPPTVDVDEFKADFPGQLMQFLVIDFLEREHPRVGHFLKVMGVIRETRVSDAGLRPAYIRRQLAWVDLTNLLDDPFVLTKTAYKWGESQFDIERLTFNLAGLFSTMELEFQLQRPHPSLFTFLTQENIGLQPYHHWTLSLPLIQDRTSSLKTELGIGLYYLPETASAKPGLALVPYARGNLSAEIELSDTLTLIVQAGGDIDSGIAITLRPNQDPQVHFDIITSGGAGVILSQAARLVIGVINQESGGGKTLLVGSEGGSRLEVGSLSATGGLHRDAQGSTDGYAEVDLREGNLVITSGQGDGFLQKILPPDGVSTAFDFAIGLSYLQGFYFRGSAALEITIPVHESIGPLTIESAYLTVRIADDARIGIVLAASVGAEIGPVSASVQRIGIKTAVSFPGSGGNLGPLQFDTPVFNPPTGAGLVIDASALVGGGYVEFDSENERYAGIIQLAFGEIELGAIGLITTRMPDGSKSFSMLFILSAEFDPPITLPYNFNLSAVGGLVGIHRTMLVDVLRQGIKNRTMDSILFPENPILNAPRIISDLRAVFPPAQDRYLIGPMAILNWGNPPLVRAELGILIEIPSPVRIAILGQLTLELPKREGQAAGEEEDKVLVEIHMDVLGVIDFDEKTFSFDATLYDSRILAFTLSGDSAMRLKWGDNPTFALSVGGLHPRFTPPPNFPTLRRLQLSLGSGNNPRINLDNYLALTSNSAQFGAKLEVYAQKGAFSVHGYMGFDVLFIFSPFSFMADIGAGVAVKKGSRTLLSVTLDLALSGPKPWHAKGKATFKVLFVKVKVRFDKKWGSGRPEPLPRIDPWPLLKTALEEPGNWTAKLPAESQHYVSLRTDVSGGASSVGDPAVLHPMGALEVRQRVLPFNIELDVFGNAPIAGANRYVVPKVWLGTDDPDSAPWESPGYGKEFFARAQFEQMSDSEKLSRPSFEKLDASIVAQSGEVATGASRDYTLEYETEIIDEAGVAHRDDDPAHRQLLWQAARYYVIGGAARKSRIWTSGSDAYATPGMRAKIGLSEENYKVVTTTNLQPEPAIEQDGKQLTQAEATRLMQSYLTEHPERAGELQVVPSYELEMAA